MTNHLVPEMLKNMSGLSTFKVSVHFTLNEFHSRNSSESVLK